MSPFGWTSQIKKFFNIFILRKIQLLILHFEVKHVYGPKKIDYGPNELIVLCLIRDGELHVKSFIEHYLHLGVRHIVFLDNNSTDATVTIAQNYENVTILQTKLAFKYYKIAMRHYLIRRFAKKGRWVLSVDADELFDYPFSNHVSLNALLRYLDENSYTAVVAHMLDMFSDKLLANQQNGINDSLRDTYQYYDLNNITKMDYFFPGNQTTNKKIAVYFGGIRKTVFGSANNKVGVLLTKHPLFFRDGKTKPLFINEHDVRYAHIADFSCVLYHYKFLSDFQLRAARNAREESYYNNSVEYKRYVAVLEENPHLQIKQETSQKLTSINELIDNGFLVVSQDYLDWVSNYRSLNSVVD